MIVKKIISYLSKILVVIPFALTYKALVCIAKLFHLTYKAINIIVWYALLPLLWAGILDHKLHQVLFVPAWAIFCIGVGILQRKQWNKFCDTMFRLSQEFIILFGNYWLWSVLICLLLPAIITIVLLMA